MWAKLCRGRTVGFPRGARAAYDSIVTRHGDESTTRPPRPGLAKAGRHGLLLRKRLELWQSSDYGWRELFEAADVISEGAVHRDEVTYFGTTSILLPYASRGGLVPDELGRAVTRMAARDPHARLRAVRIACREAQVRAGRPIARLNAEVVVRPDSRGVRVDVDVEARVQRAASSSSRRASSTRRR
jgi:hypothetical protein